MQLSISTLKNRETDIAHLSGQMDSMRGQVPTSRLPHIAPRQSNIREHSPAPRLTSPTRSKEVKASSFGFGKPLAKPHAAPELRGKSSRNVLRRKPSSIAQSQGNPRSAVDGSGSASPSTLSLDPREARPSIENSLRSIEADSEKSRRLLRTKPSETPATIPELDRYRTTLKHHVEPSKKFGDELPHKLATQDLLPPTQLLSGTPVYSGISNGHNRYSGYSGHSGSGSPSTRFSESPGPGASSRDTTPTSMSSQSPGIVAPLKMTTPRLRQGSPAVTRPPVTRRKAGSNANETIEEIAVDPHGLPSLLESLTSSSSNSTVRGEKRVNEENEKRRKKKELSQPPPSPPPRKSSQKFKKPRSDESESSFKASEVFATPVITSPSESPVKSRRSPQQAHNKSSPPLRPSREGAPNLHSQLESMAVIQSNLDGISFPQNRRQSALPHLTPLLQPQQASRSQQAGRLPSSHPSPSPLEPSSAGPSPANAGLGRLTHAKTQIPAPRSVATRTPSPNLATTKPRFGFFGRRTKTAPEVSTVESQGKAATRKGPTAGTGHEGYGRLGLRGRSTSATGVGKGRHRNISAASSLQDSAASTQTHDPFLLERMSPVFISGGGDIIENRNASSELSLSESNTSDVLERPSIDSKDSSNKSGVGHRGSRTTLWPSAFPKDLIERTSTLASPRSRRPSDSSDDGVGKGSSIASWRSVRRLSNASGSLALPRPLQMCRTGASGSMTSLDASILSTDSEQYKIEAIGDLERGPQRQMIESKDLGKQSKSSRKWNFFHRSTPAPKPHPEVAMQVTIGRPPIKPMPHYAMLDSSDEQLNSESIDLEDILCDADVVSLTNEELDALQFGYSKDSSRQNEDLHMTRPEVLEERAHLAPSPLPVPTEPMPSTPEMRPTNLHLTPETAPVRPSRLPQVGRIPKVMSARPETTSPKSFSRPFARLSTHQPLQSPIVLDNESIALGPSPAKTSTPGSHPTEPQSVLKLIDTLRRNSADFKAEARHRDFLAFSPRTNSEATTSSSGDMSFAGTTAVIPKPNAALEEDEVWDEYDDLIENDGTSKVPVSATSSHGHPFQYENYESQRVRKSKAYAHELPTLDQAPQVLESKDRSHSLPRQSVLTSSSIYSTDLTTSLKDALTMIPTPTTPMSFNEFFSGYGDRNNSAHGDLAEKMWRSSQSSSRKSASSSSHSRRSGLLSITEEDKSPLSQVNLRVGSMTVSKWLTFGHVHFSPARESIVQSEGSKRHSILVIDGLGNGTFPCPSIYHG